MRSATQEAVVQEAEVRNRGGIVAKNGDTLPMRTRLAKGVALCAALVISAFVMALAVGSPTAPWLGWVALVPLFFATRVLTPVRAALAGSLWGVTLALSAAVRGDTGFASTPQSVALLAAIPGLYAGLGALLTRQIGFSPLLLALGWIGVEFSLQPLGIRNGLLVGTLGNGLFVRTLGHLAGYVLLAFLVAYVNASVLEVVTSVCRPVGGGRLVLRSTRGGERRLLPLEVPTHLFHLARQAQPRAPPR